MCKVLIVSVVTLKKKCSNMSAKTRFIKKDIIKTLFTIFSLQDLFISLQTLNKFEFRRHGDDGRCICPLLPVPECNGVHAFTDRRLPSDSVSDSIFHKVSKSFRQPRNRYKCTRKYSFLKKVLIKN